MKNPQHNNGYCRVLNEGRDAMNRKKKKIVRTPVDPAKQQIQAEEVGVCKHIPTYGYLFGDETHMKIRT